MRRRDPANVVDNITITGEPADEAPHVVTVRTPEPGLVFYRDIHARTKQALAALGIFNGDNGILVRDDYGGWHQFDATLAGVRQTWPAQVWVWGSRSRSRSLLADHLHPGQCRLLK